MWRTTVTCHVFCSKGEVRSASHICPVSISAASHVWVVWMVVMDSLLLSKMTSSANRLWRHWKWIQCKYRTRLYWVLTPAWFWLGNHIMKRQLAVSVYPFHCYLGNTNLSYQSKHSTMPRLAVWLEIIWRRFAETQMTGVLPVACWHSSDVSHCQRKVCQ